MGHGMELKNRMADKGTECNLSKLECRLWVEVMGWRLGAKNSCFGR